MSVTELFFKTSENEQIETVINMSPDRRCAIFGTVIGTDGKPIQDALVLLFEANDPGGTVKSRSFTDESGRFAFGPLNANELHKVLIYKDNTKIRELEIVTD